MPHTEEEARAWVAEIRDELLQSLQDCQEVPAFYKNMDHFKEVWCAGCWMNEKLREAGATEQEIHDIGFAHGQRSLFGNTYRWAVKYLNEFEANGKVEDKPGAELADRINDTHMQRGDGFVTIMVEK